MQPLTAEIPYTCMIALQWYGTLGSNVPLDTLEDDLPSNRLAVLAKLHTTTTNSKNMKNLNNN